MHPRIARVTLVVRDYDEALSFYRDALGFVVLEDSRLSATKRWVVVAPADDEGCALLLARADGPEQDNAIGNQCGGRVGFFLFTDDIDRDLDAMLTRGVRFLEPVRDETYGRVAVFADLYGNRWDLLQPAGEE